MRKKPERLRQRFLLRKFQSRKKAAPTRKSTAASRHFRALKRREELTFKAYNMDDIKNILNKQPGFIRADFCGCDECEEKIKEINGCKSRCITDDELLTGKCVCCGNEAKYSVIWGIQY